MKSIAGDQEIPTETDHFGYFPSSPIHQATVHNLLIRNAAIIDGTGSPAFVGDVSIDGDEIAAVGHSSTGAREEIDGEGLTVCPGFIDIHTHSDFSLLLDGRAESAVYQGVTTQVNGNCGICWKSVLT